MSAPTTGPLVVIPCLNEAANLPALLDFLLIDLPKDGLVVVADGGSTDGSRDHVQALEARNQRVRFLDNPKRIQGAGLNLASVEFGGGRRWLVRVDAHAIYPPGYVARLVEVGERIGCQSVVVPMVTQAEPGLRFQRAVAAAQNSKIGTGGSAHRSIGAGRFIDHGHHALFDLQAFLAAGGYDESFTHNEDAELDVRLTRAGGRIWIEPALAIVYLPRSAPGPLLRQYINYGGGRARTLQRHRMRLKIRQAAPLMVGPALIVALVGFLLTPLSPLLGLVLAAPAVLWGGLCLSIGAAMALRSRDVATLASGPAAMIMHLGWSYGFWRQILFRARPGAEPAPLTLGSGSG